MSKHDNRKAAKKAAKKAKAKAAKPNVKETLEQKEQRYLTQNGGGPLTEKQLARLGKPLSEQHAAVRKEEPANPGATGAPTRIAQDELVDLINAAGSGVGTPSADAALARMRRGETFRIDSAHTDRHAADKDFESARSRITRYARKLGLQYSTQKQTDGQGDRYLAVHLSI